MQGKGYFSLGREGAFGVDSITPAFVPVKDASPTQDPGMYYPEYIRNSRMVGQGVPGARKAEMSVTADMEPDSIGWWLTAALGAPVSTMLVAGVYQHVFKGGAATLPSFTAWAYDGETAVTKIAGAKCDEITMTVEAGAEAAEVEISFKAKTLTDGGAPGAPAYTDKRPWTFADTTVKKGGAVYDAMQQFELSISNNLKDDEYRLTGSRDVAELPEGMQVVEFSMDLRFKTKADKDAFTNNTADNWQVVLKGDLISGANFNQLTIDLPKSVYDQFETPISASEQASVASVQGQAICDPASATTVTFTLINTKVTYN